MSRRGQSCDRQRAFARLIRVSCEEFGYGLGRPDGILVLKYRSMTRLAFGENREDFLHQFYWSPDGLLSARHGGTPLSSARTRSSGSHRAVTHEVHAADRQTVYRICLREVPDALDGLRAGVAAIDADAARLVLALAVREYDECDALSGPQSHHGRAHAPRPDRATTGSPPVRASRCRSPWRWPTIPVTPPDSTNGPNACTSASRRCNVTSSASSACRTPDGGPGCACVRRWHCWRPMPVGEVAHRIGYASPSAFIAAFAREYGYTPGRAAARTHGDAPAPSPRSGR